MKSTISFTLGALVASNALAVPVYFSGLDLAGPGQPRPNADAAHAAFQAAAGALGSVQQVNFESTPLGNFSNLNVGGGLSIMQVFRDPTFPSGGITNAADTTSTSPLGYNTTAGGSRYLRVCPSLDVGTATTSFNFTTPVQAFGAFVTDLEPTVNGLVTVQFSDGGAQSFPLPEGLTNTVQFFGFTSAGQSVTSVRFVETGLVGGSRDIYGIDDLRYVLVPEPAAIAGVASSFLLLLRRRRSTS